MAVTVSSVPNSLVGVPVRVVFHPVRAKRPESVGISKLPSIIIPVDGSSSCTRDSSVK